MEAGSSFGAAARLFLLWCGFTALSQVLSGGVLSARGASPSALLAVQAAASAVVWLMLMSGRYLAAAFARRAKSPIGSSVTLEETAAVVPDGKRAAGEASPTEGAILVPTMPPLTLRDVGSQIVVAFVNAVGMLSAHFATSLLRPAQAQVLKNGEIAFAFAFSMALGLRVGDDPARVARASALVVLGALLTAQQHLWKSGGDAGAAWAGVGWATVSAACFGARGVLFKTLGVRDVRVDSPLMALVLGVAGLLALAASCGGWDALVLGKAHASDGAATCAASLGAAATSWSALLSGGAWFAYQWASFAMLRVVSPVTHTILNNAKRAVVTLVIFAAFPTSAPWSPVYTVGVVCMLEGVAVLAMGSTVSATAVRFAAQRCRKDGEGDATTTTHWNGGCVAASSAALVGACGALVPAADGALESGCSRRKCRRYRLLVLLLSIAAISALVAFAGGQGSATPVSPPLSATVAGSGNAEPRLARAAGVAKRLQSQSQLQSRRRQLQAGVGVGALDDGSHEALQLTGSRRACPAALTLSAARATADAVARSQMADALALACPAPRRTARKETNVLVGLHVGWFGRGNVGDDIMPPLFATQMAAALRAEFPGLNVSVEVRDCAAASLSRSGRRPPAFSTRKHFWAIGGGSVIEYLAQRDALHSAAASSWRRREPLYVLGAGFQSNRDFGFVDSNLLRVLETVVEPALPQSGSRARLLWGGMRGPLSRDVLAAAALGDALPVIGDPGFLADSIESLFPRAAASQDPRLRLSGVRRAAVTSCDTQTVPELPGLMRQLLPVAWSSDSNQRTNVSSAPTIAIVSLGNFEPRQSAMTKTYAAMRSAYGPRARPLQLHRMADLPLLYDTLRGTELGVHCMLHGGIIQASLSGSGAGPVLGNFNSFKQLDAWLPTGLTSASLLHHMREKGSSSRGGRSYNRGWSRVTTSTSVVSATAEARYKAQRILSTRGSAFYKVAIAKFRVVVSRRHAAAMQAFVRHITSAEAAYPDAGAALACSAASGAHIIVRAHTLYEGALLQVLWSDR